MVRLLAIDTTEDACSAALALDGEITERFELAPRRHNELILPMMDALLATAGLSVQQLDALAFARGPGGFTGLRIAASVIQGVGLASELPVVPVSSLQALAEGCEGATGVLTAFDARMSEVYWGAFRRDDAGLMRAVIDESVCSPAQVQVPEGTDWRGIGSGWGSYAELLGKRCLIGGAPDGDACVHAADVARLAVTLFDEGAAVDVEHALPVYLRNKVAAKAGAGSDATA